MQWTSLILWWYRQLQPLILPVVAQNAMNVQIKQQNCWHLALVQFVFTLSFYKLTNIKWFGLSGNSFIGHFWWQLSCQCYMDPHVKIKFQVWSLHQGGYRISPLIPAAICRSICQTTTGRKFLLTATVSRAVVLTLAFNLKAYIVQQHSCASVWDFRDSAQQPLPENSARGQRWQMSSWQVKQPRKQVTMAIKCEHVSSGSLNTHCSPSIIILWWIRQLEKAPHRRLQNNRKSDTSCRVILNDAGIDEVVQIISTTF